MTNELYNSSAQEEVLDESTPSFGSEQHEPLDRARMAFSGPHMTQEEERHEPWTAQRSSRQNVKSCDRGTNTQPTAVTSRSVQTNTEHHVDDQPTRTSLHELTVHARLQRHHEVRKVNLRTRIRILQRSVALAARLKRSSSWVQDGLVEISKHQDTSGFIRTFSHAHDLVDSCYSHWNNELQNLDILQSVTDESQQVGTAPPFFDQLPPRAQSDLLKLLCDLRSNPKFIIDRLSQLPISQVATLTAKPKWEASESLLASLSQQSGGSAQRKRRVQAFSKELEDYASAFERNDPFAFMIHNVYSNDCLPESPEHHLRLWTWSSVCSELLIKESDSYKSLYWQALEAFSAMQDWPAKTRIELFLMDVLQRGAFLIRDGTTHRSKPKPGTSHSQQEQDFFESAVYNLYWTLINCDTGCYPTGALEFAQAILGKLPGEEHQSHFRSHFFESWYLHHFLKTAIMYPENEDMLLKIHVSKQARECVLAPLFNLFASKYETFQDEQTGDGETIQNIILGMINMLEGTETSNPYNIPHDKPDPSHTPAITICASECIKVLETLSPQAIYSSHYMSDGIMRDIGQAFQAQYSTHNTRFDLLKQDLMQLLEPGASPKDTHPCLEAWADFEVDKVGSVGRTGIQQTQPFLQILHESDDLTCPQKAAVKFCIRSTGESSNELLAFPDKWGPEATLRDLFAVQATQSQAITNTIDALYWRRALSQLTKSFPLCLPGEDSLVLAKVLSQVQATNRSDLAVCNDFEIQLGPWEKTFNSFKGHIKSFMASLEGLRLKLWYTSEIVSSRRYIEARNIALALSHMNILHLRMSQASDTHSKGNTRPASSRSTISSMFGQPRDDAMEILKAPTEQGGPRKLADQQVESIKQWFQQNNIDNFCRGEERLHRFCMEVWQVARTLTGETMLDSGELWGSELFARERTSYDIGFTYGVNSAPASTRPASVISDSFASGSSFPSLSRPGLRSPDSDTRSIVSDDRVSNRRGSVYHLFAGRLFPNPQLLAPSLASSMSSYGRTSSATTTASEIFSQPSQSVTSASVYSRPPSILHGSLPNFAPKSHGTIRDRKKFRDKLKVGLSCLLLSDLGSLVWSWGCETDAWLSEAQGTKLVTDRVHLILSSEALRLNDAAPQVTSDARRNSAPRLRNPDEEGENETEEVGYIGGLEDTLSRMSQQIDPVGKLKACLDFDALALEQLDSISKAPELGVSSNTANYRLQRRASDDTAHTISTANKSTIRTQALGSERTDIDDQRTVLHYKKQLARLRPQTIFRDLQYIAVFTPPEMLDKTPAGKALMRLGVAALEYKKDLCSSMVHVASRVMIADGIKRKVSTPVEPTLSQVVKYWKTAAVEGHKVAQRELALMYLMHPEVVSIVTLPLSPPSKIFRDDMMWQKKETTEKSRQALCLALHWMQQAAKEGDHVAMQKLREREGEISLP